MFVRSVLRSPSRRGLLCAAGGALAATAGCLGRVRDAATGVDYPDPGQPTYRRWLPAPEAVPGVDGPYDASHVRVADLRGDGPVARVGIGLQNLLARTGRDPLGLPEGAVDAVVNINLARATTLLGAFDPAAAGEAASGAGYRAVGSHRGLELYERPGRGRGLGIGSDAVVFARGREPVATVRAVVDAGRGAADRYHETDPAFARLSAAAGGATTAWVFPEGGFGADDVEGATGSASARQFGGGRSYVGRFFLFPDAEAASAGAVRAAADGGIAGPTTPLDAAVEGRLGRLEYSRPVGAVADEVTPVLQPIVAWAFEPDPDAGRVEVVHRAGDPVSADRLRLLVDGSPADRQFAAAHDTVRPGDSVTVPVDPEIRVRVVWKLNESSATLAAYEVPAGSS